MSQSEPSHTHHDGHEAEHHPYLAHHFSSMQQQFASAKLGMWVFLATEILMFGGLFLAYAFFRAHHPDVFYWAHYYLDTRLGLINTILLLASSFTMAWGVRAAMLNQRRLLSVLLTLTLLGGLGFMVIKAYEYTDKFHKNLWVGTANAFWSGERAEDAEAFETIRMDAIDYRNRKLADKQDAAEQDGMAGDLDSDPQTSRALEDQAAASLWPPRPTDRALPITAAAGPVGTRSLFVDQDITPIPVLKPETLNYEDLTALEQSRVHMFFQIYFLMTGLHTLHVIIGLGIIYWLIYRSVSGRFRAMLWPTIPIICGAYLIYVGLLIPALPLVYLGVFVLLAGLAWLGLRLPAVLNPQARPSKGDFDSGYFTPVDIGGLYWHLVDLIWIFLFPLLYLIH